MSALTTPNLPLNVHSQQRRIIEYLQTNTTGLNRYDADLLLNVCQFPARIFELKEQGHIFVTITETAIDLVGRTHHNIARQFWKGFKAPERPTSNDEDYVE